MSSRTCERCGKKHLNKFVWLELDSLTNRFHKPGELPADGLSQGLFPFGAQCARATLRAEGLAVRR